MNAYKITDVLYSFEVTKWRQLAIQVDINLYACSYTTEAIILNSSSRDSVYNCM